MFVPALAFKRGGGYQLIRWQCSAFGGLRLVWVRIVTGLRYKYVFV